jgi:hypothetical protein
MNSLEWSGGINGMVELYVAMKNAYYISNGPMQFLVFQGYSWSGGGAGKKKEKGGKKRIRIARELQFPVDYT